MQNDQGLGQEAAECNWLASVSPENEKQAAERCRLEDALEDDEVHEALTSLRAERQPKKTTTAKAVAHGADVSLRLAGSKISQSLSAQTKLSRSDRARSYVTSTNISTRKPKHSGAKLRQQTPIEVDAH